MLILPLRPPQIASSLRFQAAKESDNPWRFRNTSLFSRLDSFLERCHDVLDLVESLILFTRLERVEIGGTKGKQLSADIVSIHKEFNEGVLLLLLCNWNPAEKNQIFLVYFSSVKRVAHVTLKKAIYFCHVFFFFYPRVGRS